MIRLVKLALTPPYTLAAMAALIKIFGVAAIVSTQAGVFPSVNAPVIGAAFSDPTLSPDDNSARLDTFDGLSAFQDAGPDPFMGGDSSS